MGVSPAIIKLFLRSAKVPPAVIEVFDLVEKQGFEKLGFQRMADADPSWHRIKADDTRNRTGFWVQCEGPSSRVTMAVFIEGANDEILSKLDSFGGGDLLLPDATSATV